MTPITFASTTSAAGVERQSLSRELTYENRWKAAVEHARRLTKMYGYQHVDVAIAWETVEELRSARSRQPIQSVPSCKSMFDRYCSESPNALECRSYDC